MFDVKVDNCNSVISLKYHLLVNFCITGFILILLILENIKPCWIGFFLPGCFLSRIIMGTSVFSFLICNFIFSSFIRRQLKNKTMSSFNLLIQVYGLSFVISIILALPIGLYIFVLIMLIGEKLRL